MRAVPRSVEVVPLRGVETPPGRGGAAPKSGWSARVPNEWARAGRKAPVSATR